MSGMHLLPAYFTTTNTRKRKTNKKSKSLLEAERKHAKFLAKHCGKPGGANDTKSLLRLRKGIESSPPPQTERSLLALPVIKYN